MFRVLLVMGVLFCFGMTSSFARTPLKKKVSIRDSLKTKLSKGEKVPAYLKVKSLLKKKAVQVDWNTLNLNRTIQPISKKTLINKGVKKPQVGFTWDLGDRKTHHWFPQGITGLGNKRLAVSWYSKHGLSKASKAFPPDAEEKTSTNRGVRISFVDLNEV